MKNLSNAEYHGDTSRVSKSGLDKVNKSPAHYYAAYLDPNREPRKPTDAMLFGTASHTTVLEADKIEREYFIFDDTAKCLEIGGGNPRATTKYKEWKAMQLQLHAGKQEIRVDVWDKLCRMRESVRKHPAAAMLLENGTPEQTMFWDDAETGAPCKMRPDWLPGSDIIVDLKTTEDASPNGFARSILNYRYDVQGAFYSDGYLQATGRPCQGFVFIAVEKEPPYAVAVYYMTAEAYDLGKRKYSRNLQTYMECLRTGVWPAYSDQVQPVSLPAWALNAEI